MRLSQRKRFFTIICLVLLLIMLFLKGLSRSFIDLSDSYAASVVQKHKLLFKKDWHDHDAMARDAQRVGPGEQGKPALIEHESLRDLEQELFTVYGFNALLSNAISVNRSLPDLRYEGCHNKTYLTKLPTVSIIMPFYNECFSVLSRSLHSLVNRSPPELLKEIILVDDNSNHADLFGPLEHYVAQHFPMVHIVRLAKRSGLIVARMAGARKATGDVLVLFDSHIEVNYNWLPPLIEPIALNKRTATLPFTDVIQGRDFKYRSQSDGSRGSFAWNFDFKRLPLLPEDLKDITSPFKTPAMPGGLLAIRREFFFELGGFDEGLMIWGGENYELSFKIWMCGGELLDVPCSRVGHVFRDSRKGEFYHRNFKRVAEVWMDEYKNYIYMRGEGLYAQIDAGDLTEQKALRAKLKCKSFKWYMENVAFDLEAKYPVIPPPEYAYGAIKSVSTPTLCLDSPKPFTGAEIRLMSCSNDLKYYLIHQNWSLSHQRDLRQRHMTLCIDATRRGGQAQIILYACFEQGGNQFWYYNRERQWLQHMRDGKFCLEANPREQKVDLKLCDAQNEQMRWEFAVTNNTALDEFFS